MTGTPLSQRSELIDAWRALAALAVVMFHGREIGWVGIRSYSAQVPPGLSLDALIAYGSLPLTFGGMGVAVFFALSGYCIHLGHARRLAADPAYVVPAGDYLRRRALRIYPTFLAALAATAALDAITRAVTPGNPKLGDDGWPAFLLNAASLQNLVAPNYGSNYPLWSLSVEMHLYLAYLAFMRIRSRFGLPALVALVAAANLLSLWLSRDGGIVLFTNYLVAWWAGAVCAEVDWTRRHDLRAWVAGGAALFIAGCAAHWTRQTDLATLLCAVGFAMILGPSLSWRHAGGRAVRALARVGTFSYSLYLVHLPVLVCFCAVTFAGTKQLSPWPAVAGIAVACAAGFAFFLVAERPSLRALRRMRASA